MTKMPTIQKYHELTGLELRFIQFFTKIRYLVKYDNNNHPDIIWGDIKKLVDELSDELKG
jgi:hypothetical protein